MPDVTTILRFDAGDGAAEIIVDGAMEITLAGASLSAGGPLLSRLSDGHWQIGDRPLKRITCQGVVRVQLKGKSDVQDLGPFAEFSLSDDVARADNAILARYIPLERTWSMAGRKPAPPFRHLGDAFSPKTMPNALSLGGPRPSLPA